MLERDAPYVQIIEHFRQEIRSGRLQDGDMLPSGREIAQQFGVSLATAAKVATGLQALGLVTPRPGAGTMVTAPRPPADRARGGPLLITLATRTPARPGDKARVLEAGTGPGTADRGRAAGRRAHDAGDPPAAGHRAGRRDGRGADVMVPGGARGGACRTCCGRRGWPRRSPATSRRGARTGCRPGRRHRRRPGSSGSSAARRSSWCTAAGSAPMTACWSTPS